MKLMAASTKSHRSDASTSVMPREVVQNIEVLQGEVCCLHELACSFHETGKLEDATAHYYHGLAAVKKVSHLKKELRSQRNLGFEEEQNDQSSTMRANERRPGSYLLPVDSDSAVWKCIHWETITTVALMHNSAMIHLKTKNYIKAKNMLNLARGLLKTALSDKTPHSRSLHRLVETNAYVVSVVASLYVSTGRVLLELSKSLNTDIHSYQFAHCQAQAKQTCQMASSLLQRYKKREDAQRERAQERELEREQSSLSLRRLSDSSATEQENNMSFAERTAFMNHMNSNSHSTSFPGEHPNVNTDILFASLQPSMRSPFPRQQQQLLDENMCAVPTSPNSSAHQQRHTMESNSWLDLMELVQLEPLPFSVAH
jgi:hypothetical protein